MPVLHEILLISSALLKIARQSHYKYFLLDHSLGHVKFVPFGGTGPGTCTTEKTTMHNYTGLDAKPAPVAGRGQSGSSHPCTHNANRRVDTLNLDFTNCVLHATRHFVKTLILE